MKNFLICSALLLCAGCQGNRPVALSAEESVQANFGAYPSDYQERTKKYFNSILKDPYSAVYDFSMSPAKARVFSGILNGGGHVYGYTCIVGVNAKNSFGGYVGMQHHQLFFRNDGMTFDITGAMFDYVVD